MIPGDLVYRVIDTGGDVPEVLARKVAAVTARAYRLSTPFAFSSLPVWIEHGDRRVARSRDEALSYYGEQEARRAEDKRASAANHDKRAAWARSMLCTCGSPDRSHEPTCGES